MPTDDDKTVLPFSLPSLRQKKVTAGFDAGQLSSTGGVWLLAGADRRLGLIDTLAAIIPDHRDPAQITHTVADILRARVLGHCLWLSGCRRSGRFAQRSSIQAGLRAIARER